MIIKNQVRHKAKKYGILMDSRKSVPGKLVHKELTDEGYFYIFLNEVKKELTYREEGHPVRHRDGRITYPATDYVYDLD